MKKQAKSILIFKFAESATFVNPRASPFVWCKITGFVTISTKFRMEKSLKVKVLAVLGKGSKRKKNSGKHQPSGAGGTPSPPTTPNCPLNPKRPTGSGKMLTLRLFDPPINVD